MSSADFTLMIMIYTPGIGTLSYTVSSALRRIQHIFCSYYQSECYNFHSTTPGTHHHWVGRGSMEWEVCPTLLYMTSCANRSPELLILESNILSTGPHAPIALSKGCFQNSGPSSPQLDSESQWTSQNKNSHTYTLKENAHSIFALPNP